MKIYKFNESTQNKYNIGDYIIANEVHNNDDGTIITSFVSEKDINEFLNNNIGQIIEPTEEIMKEYNDKYDYYVSYEYVPKIYKYDFFFFDNYSIRPFNEDEIVFCSPNKKDLEFYIDANKYNL